MTDNWYQMSGEDVAKKLKTSQTEGLTRKAARVVLRKSGKNEIYPVSKITFYNCIKAMTMDYTSFLLIATALIAAVFEKTVGAWTLLTLVAVNLLATLLIYTKSQKILEGMDRYTLPVVRVIRDGRLFMIDQKQLVPGDLIVLSKGDIVPADARLIEAKDLCTDEERLFGRGSLRFKTAEIALHETLPPEKQRNMVFASTLIASGEATAVVTATGDRTLVCALDKNRPIITHENMPILGLLGKIGRVWSLIVIGAVFVMTLLDFLMPGVNNSLFVSFIKSMSFAVSTMSEMYVAFGYIVLACAVYRTVQMFREASAGAVIKDPLCMDKLRHLTCLVLPKEGVFTTRDTIADRICAGDRVYDISDRRGRRAMERPILFAILSTGMYGAEYMQKQSRAEGAAVRTEEEAALLNLARSMDIYNVRLDRAYPLLEHRGAEGESLFETTLVSHKNQLLAVSRGETEEILSRCSYYYKDGRLMLLTAEVRTSILIAYRKLVRRAYSVVGVASRAHSYNNLKFIGAAQKDMVFEGFVAFRVPYLPGVGQLVTDAKEAGIKLIMLSDRPAASESYFAKQIGIIDDREQAVDGATLHTMKEGIRRTNASYYRLYCGLDGEQKRELLTYLHEDGEVVGYLGRGLSELHLMRAADVSFAQNITVTAAAGQGETVMSKVSDHAGEDGCEALKFESHILVSDAGRRGFGGFRAILDAIAIAKNTDMNLIRILKYLFCSQTARFLLVLYTILFDKEGMTAVQTLFSGLFADFFAVLILAFGRPSVDTLRTGGDATPYLSAPIKSNISSFITGASWACAAILSSFFASLAGFAVTEAQTGSVLFLTSTLISVIMLFSVQKDDFLWRPGTRMSALHTIYLLVLTELFLIFFLFPALGSVFGVVKFDPRGILVIAVVAAMMTVLAECIKMLARMRERPELAEQEAQADEERSALATLFHRFRAQKELEEREQNGIPTEEEKTRGRRFTFKRTKPQDAQTKNVRMAETDGVAADNGASSQNEDLSRTEEMAAYVEKAKAKRRKKRTGPLPRTKEPGMFEEDDGEELYADRRLRTDDALMQALQDENAIRRALSLGEDGDPYFGVSDLPEDMAVPAEEETVPGLPGVELPDPDVYDAAAAGGITGESYTGDITVGGTDAEVRDFLRTRTGILYSDEETEAEFPGIGYLFSDAEYEAIMAEYNQEGGKTDLYDTNTRKIEPVSKDQPR